MRRARNWFKRSFLGRIGLFTSNAPTNLKLFRLLLDRKLWRFTFRHPRVLYKHLDPYAASQLKAPTRLQLIHGHYDYIRGNFGPALLGRMHDAPLQLWNGNNACSIAVKYPVKKAAEWEGELCLTFSMDSKPLYDLVFLIVPGRIADIADSASILITSVQGKNDLQEIRRAQLACGDIQPSHLLMAAIGGFAEGLGDFQLLGVGDQRQVKPEISRWFSYDDLFSHYSSTTAEDGLFKIDELFSERALSAKSASHRKRSMKKRVYKREVAQHVAEVIRGLINDRSSH